MSVGLGGLNACTYSSQCMEFREAVAGVLGDAVFEERCSLHEWYAGTDDVGPPCAHRGSANRFEKSHKAWNSLSQVGQPARWAGA